MKLLIALTILCLGISSCGHPEDGKDGQPGGKGNTGIPGEPGVQGLPGPRGEVGPAGAEGAKGIDGQDGADGSDGVSGIDGEDGTDGTDGQDGENGTTPIPFEITLTAEESIANVGKEGLLSLPGYISFQAFDPDYQSASRHYVRVNILPAVDVAGSTKSFCYRRLLFTAIYILEAKGINSTSTPCSGLPAAVVSGADSAVLKGDRLEFISEDAAITELNEDWELTVSGIGTP